MKNYFFLSILFFISVSANAQSESELREKLLINPNDPRLNYDLGIWIANERRYPEAIGFLSKAAHLDTITTIYMYELGYCYEFFIKNIDSAMYCYREAGIRLNRNNETTYDNGWRKLLELSEITEHVDYYIEAYENMLNIDYNHKFNFSAQEKYALFKEIRDNPTASTFMKIGDTKTEKIGFNEKIDAYIIRFDKGIAAYEKAIEIDPTIKDSAYKIMGSKVADHAYYAFFEYGDYEGALTQYQIASKYDPKNPEIYSAIGYIQLEKLDSADYKNAIVNFQKALTLTTGSMEKKDLYENIGLCYEMQKDYKNAIIYYEKGIALEPNFAKSIHFKLTRVYVAMGNTVKADYHRTRS